METISTKELCGAIDTISRHTMISYLSNYRFNKFRKTKTDGINARYEVSPKFLNMLYTHLWHRNRFTDAQKLKKLFRNYDIQVIEWEEYVK